MKNYQKFLLLGLIATIIGLNSCKKEDTSFHKHDGKEDFKKVAKFLSTSDTETKNRLFQTYQNKGIEEFYLADFLKANDVTNRGVTNMDELNALVLENPMITIAYPSFSLHNELFVDHLGLIDYTVILIDEDIETAGTLPAFNSSGELVQISSTFDESLRYCVVKYNEGYIAINPSTKKTYFGDDVSPKLFDFAPREKIGTYLMYSAADLINSRFKEEGRLLGEQVVGSAACDKPCERDCFMKKDELHKVKFSSKSCIKNFESGWHLPKLEMIAYYAIPRYSSGAASVDLVAKDVFIHCDKICGKFSEPLELEIATWTPDLGNRWQVLWIERDYWDKVQDKFSLGFSVGFKVKDPVTGTETSVAANAAWEITSMKQDKEIGRSLVEYCDKALNEGETYKPCSCDASGGFWFKEHLKQ